jgi:hypothetical protein
MTVFNVFWLYFDVAPSPTSLLPSPDIILPESSQMINLTGVDCIPRMSADCIPAGHDLLDM